MRKIRRKKQKSSKKLLLLAILVLTVGIGFASLQKYLSINGTASIDSNFDVSIINIQKIESQGNAYEKSEASYTATTANFDVGLMAPGDSLTYAIDVANRGDLNAKLESIELNQIGSSNIKFEVSGMNEGDVLASYSTKTIQVMVSYSGTASEEISKQLTITLLFAQTSENTQEQQDEIAEFQASKSVTVNDYTFTNVGIEWAKVSFAYGDGPYSPNFSLYNENEIIYENGAAREYTLYYGTTYNLKTKDSLIYNGSKIYSQESDVKSFLLNTLEDRFLVNTANGENEVVALASAYSSDTLYLEPNVTYKSLFMLSNEKDIKTIVIPDTVELTSLKAMSLCNRPSPAYNTVTKIVNLTGESTDWATIIGRWSSSDGQGTPETCEFETGTCGNVVITNTFD